MKKIDEKSAGGLVLKGLSPNPKILMIQVKNLVGKIVWTFPKGHLEQGETPIQAALREVEEETGWKCALTSSGKKKYFEKVHYQFFRGTKLVKKVVTWYLMTPQQKTGEKDIEEVIKVRWVSLEKAKDLLQYPSDNKLLKKLDKEIRDSDL